MTITGTYKMQFKLNVAERNRRRSTATVVTINGSVIKSAAQLPFSDWFDNGSTVTYSVHANRECGQRHAVCTH